MKTTITNIISGQRLLLSLGMITCAIVTSLAATESSTAAKQRPNVLFIAIDDLRPELGCYGDTQVKSPNIDELAARALMITRAYCQVPVCVASRASLMTSILPTARRFVRASTKVDVDATCAVSLPQVFKEAGDTTLSKGKILHFGDDTGERSWSEKAWHSDLSHFANLDPTTTAKMSAAERGRIYESPDVRDLHLNGGTTRKSPVT